MTIRIQALCRAFYNGEIIKPGQVLTIKGDIVPSWAKLVGQSKKTQKSEDNETQTEEGKQKTLTLNNLKVNVVNPTSDNTEQEQTPSVDTSKLPEEALNNLLDDLLTKTCEKGLMVDCANMTILEQIEALKKALEENEKEG